MLVYSPQVGTTLGSSGHFAVKALQDRWPIRNVCSCGLEKRPVCLMGDTGIPMNWQSWRIDSLMNWRGVIIQIFKQSESNTPMPWIGKKQDGLLSPGSWPMSSESNQDLRRNRSNTHDVYWDPFQVIWPPSDLLTLWFNAWTCHIASTKYKWSVWIALNCLVSCIYWLQ